MKGSSAAIALFVVLTFAMAHGDLQPLHGVENASLSERPDVQFGGYLRSGKEARFILITIKDQQTSPFLKVGDSFRGFKIVSFDSSREVIIIEVAERKVELPLRSAAIHHGDGGPSIAVRLNFDLRKDGSITIDGLRLDRYALAAHILKFARSGDTIEIRLRVPRGIRPDLVNRDLNDLVKPTAMHGIRLHWTPEIVD